MAYRLVPLPMTLDDHEGHSRVAGLMQLDERFCSSSCLNYLLPEQHDCY